ncbi:MAG TPA: choice-of-anchor D domain-containing protein [Bryobacteraceae bacterium]|nr:choice-of-anchor D domain-containing protein [Bryobacteraceae bacterium]
MRHSRFFLSALLMGSVAFGIAASASAQTPFQIEAQSGSTTQVVANGATVNVVANGTGQSTQATFIVTYLGAGTAAVNVPQLLGSSTFALVSAPAANLTSGQSASYVVSFTPSSGAQAQSSFSLSYTSGATTGTISLNLIGTSPNFILGYAIQPQGNAVSLSNGGTLTFPATVVGSTATALLTIANMGSAAGVLNSFSLPGTAFQTKSLPLLPVTIGAGQALQITLVYTPTAIESDSGTIQMSLGGTNVTINLVGTGVASQLNFQFTEGTQTLTVNQNQVSLPDTRVGTTATVSVVATNNGNAADTVNTISISGGGGFLIASAPPLPQTILPGASINLTLTFTPPQAGTFTAGLLVGTDTVTITAKGLGPNYQYSYTTGTTPNPVSPNGNVFFATAQLGQSSSTTFTITNTGTASGVISGIFIGEANSPFAITGLPPLPITIAVNQSLTFGITFTPTSVASLSGTLHLDGTTFILTGAGGTPPTFPSYSLTGPTGTLGPLQQPLITLNIAAPYPLDVNGTLTMTVLPDGFTADPAIQFSTGGKTVTFTIPANTTAAVFPTGSTSIRLQTGSTSGAIVLTPTFTTASNVPLTPAASQNLQLVIPPTAPVLIGAQVTAQTAAGLTLAITGVSNSQTLTQLSFSFTTAANYNVTGADVNVPVSSVASAWFQSAAAQTFGGQFVATIPFTFTGPGSTGTATSTVNLTAAVTGVTISATNAQGTSSSLMVSLP